MLKKILCCLLFSLLILLPLYAGASSAETVTETVDTVGLNNDEALQGYLDRALGFLPDITPKTVPLTGINKQLYDGLVPLIQDVAAGRRTSTVFTISASGSTDGFEFPKITHTLRANLPYDLYWHEGRCRVSISGTQYTFSFYVDSYYAVSDFETNPDVISAVQNTVTAVESIVSANQGLKDLEKLTAYKEAICDLTDYNYDAAAGSVDNENPWQLIWVFDGDPSTKVVCEGYSKAFKYLCDNSSFRSDISASLVSGTMDGGAHMWNLVRMPDGKNYLVDVTNCDSSADGSHTIGYPDKLFMVGYDSVYHGADGDGYVVYGINYVYDTDLGDIYSAEELALADSGYSAVPQGTWGGLTWALDDNGVLTINGSGEMNGFASSTDAWRAYSADILQVQIGSGITSVGNYAFEDCHNLTSVSLPDGLTSIGWAAFSGCEQLASVALPDSVTEIGSLAFAFTGLSSITLPRNLTVSQYGPIAYSFRGCASLTDILVADGNPDYTSVNGVLFTRDQTELVCYPNGKTDEAYTIPDGVATLSSSAFEGNTHLRTVCFPTSIEDIGSSAFENCSALHDIYYGGTESEWNAIYIRDENFRLNSEDNVFHFNIVSWGTYGSDQNLCWELDANGVLTLSGSGMVNIVIDNGTEIIPWAAYQSSIRSLIVESGVQQIAYGSFAGCTNLTGVTFAEGLIFIDENAFRNCSGLTGVTLPNTVTRIGPAAFGSCTGLTGITLSSGLTEISYEAFIGCSNLSSLSLPASLRTIGDSAFEDCLKLQTVSIPKNVTSIGTAAFRGCKGLKSITVNSGNANYSSASGVLFNKNKTTLICYPAGKTSGAYSVPASVTSIADYAFCYASGLTGITLPSGSISIGFQAFKACTGLTEFVFPDGFTRIENEILRGCVNLHRITVPVSVVYIDFYSFDEFDKDSSDTLGLNTTVTITDIYYPGTAAQWNAVTKKTDGGGFIEDFSVDFSAITMHFCPAPDLTLPADLTRIEAGAFTGIAEDVIVYIPGTVTSIADDAFDTGSVIILAPAGSFAAQWALSHGFECYEQ